jgi:hypothetical protein
MENERNANLASETKLEHLPGKMLSNMREIARSSLVVGSVGVASGLTLAQYRGHPLSLYAVNMGTNFALCGAA